MNRESLIKEIEDMNKSPIVLRFGVICYDLHFNNEKFILNYQGGLRYVEHIKNFDIFYMDGKSVGDLADWIISISG
jgi:hypothetical protein